MKKLLISILCMLYINPINADNKWYPQNNQTVDNVHIKQNNDGIYARKEKYENVFHQTHTNKKQQTNDTDTHAYIGANLNYNIASYNFEVPYTKFPESYFGLGLELGARFGEYNNIWNGGVSVSYDYLSESEINVLGYKIGTLGFSSIGLNFDNYIKILEQDNKRCDFILGIGISQAIMKTSIDFNDYGYDMQEKEQEKGNALVFKIGTNMQIDKGFDWYITSRWFVPKEEDSLIDFIMSIQTGIKLYF